MNQVLEINVALCDNDFAWNLHWTSSQTNNAADADQIDTVAQSNGAQITQNLLATNDCDEANTGDNLAPAHNDQPFNN